MCSPSKEDAIWDAAMVRIMRMGAEKRGEPWPPPSQGRSSIRPMPERATIYFIGPEGGPVKIGWAARLQFRFKDLCLANAYPLHVWASVEGPVKLERQYHKRFAAHRLHGEWFARVPEIEAEISRLSAHPDQVVEG